MVGERAIMSKSPVFPKTAKLYKKVQPMKESCEIQGGGPEVAMMVFFFNSKKKNAVFFHA